MEIKQVVEWATKIGILGFALRVFAKAEKFLGDKDFESGIAMVALGGILLVGFIYLMETQVERKVLPKVEAKILKSLKEK